MEEEEGQRQRSSSASSSPEFEFWMLRNPSYPQPELLTADELIVDGVVLPLHLLSLQRSAATVQPSTETPPVHPPEDLAPDSVLASASFSAAPASGSRRWKDIFKVVVERKPEEKEKERKERRSSGGVSASAELNINLNIWPFSRSHSASNTTVRPRPSAFITSRKVSSAPCSRSNSRGESSTASGGCRKWASSPARGGVHLGRAASVWKLRRTGMGPKDKARNSSAACNTENSGSEGTRSVRLLNLKVNSCIGYQNQANCRDDHSDALTGRPCTTEGSGSNGSIFSIRSLFSKKVY